MRRLLASLAGCLGIGTAFLAPFSAHALSFTDTLEIVDLAGNVLTDLDGHPAIGTFEELVGPPGSNHVIFDIEVPDDVPFSTAGQVLMIEQDPNPITHEAPVSDIVSGQLLSSSPTNEALLIVQLIGFLPPQRQTAACQTVGIDQCVREDGTFQDVTQALFGRSDLSFRVLAQSDPNPNPVPEPATLSLFGVGVATLAGRGRRAGASAR